MIAQQKLVETLRRGRIAVLRALVSGVCLVAALIIFVPSQLGFMMAGPLVVFPWALLCVAVARAPSRFALGCLVVFAMVGLAWPLLCLV